MHETKKTAQETHETAHRPTKTRRKRTKSRTKPALQEDFAPILRPNWVSRQLWAQTVLQKSFAPNLCYLVLNGRKFLRRTASPGVRFSRFSDDPRPPPRLFDETCVFTGFLPNWAQNVLQKSFAPNLRYLVLNGREFLGRNASPGVRFSRFSDDHRPPPMIGPKKPFCNTAWARNPFATQFAHPAIQNE